MKLALVFPGQGVQTLGMLNSFEGVDCVKTTLSEADSILGYALSSLIANGPEAKLHETIYTQPAIFVASVAIWRALKEKTGLAPAFFAGHSLGEYAAYVASGAIGFEDALKLVQYRAERMQEIGEKNPGGMTAIIGLDTDAIATLCKEVQGEGFVTPANFNSPQQTVIAGTKEALAKAKVLAKEKGARLIVDLAVSAPFHTAIFEPVASGLKEKLLATDIKVDSTPVIANIDAKPQADMDSLIDSLANQVSHPVQWTKTQLFLQGQGVDTLIECGPGKTLTGLAKRTMKGVKLLNCPSRESIDSIASILN